MLSEPQDNSNILEVKGLHKDYGGVKAINNLDLKIREGEIHCIIGPNGAGKSTFFKLLMGMERPTFGTVRFKNHDITKLHPFQRARLGLAVKFQNIRVFNELTVFQNLFIPLRRHHAFDEIPDRVSSLLKRIQLVGTEHELAQNLSHGQRQWLAIGMSMAVNPMVLLLDEPAAGMGSEETRETAQIIRDLNDLGVTIIVIEHDMAFVRSLDSCTSVFHLGSLFAQGSYTDIENNEDVHKIYLGSV